MVITYLETWKVSDGFTKRSQSFKWQPEGNSTSFSKQFASVPISEQHTGLLKCTRGVDSWVGCWNGHSFIKTWACFNLQVELVLQSAWIGQTLTYFTGEIQSSGRGELSVPADTKTAGCTEIHLAGHSNRPVIFSASSRGAGYVHRALAGLVASYGRASSSLLDFIHTLTRSWPMGFLPPLSTSLVRQGLWDKPLSYWIPRFAAELLFSNVIC